MKKLLLMFACLNVFIVTNVYGDDISMKGKWGEKHYRTVTPLPPVLSIDNNILSVEFTDALSNLTIRIMDATSNIMYEDTLSGEMGDAINIPLDGIQIGVYQIVLIHQLGCLIGEFENQ